MKFPIENNQFAARITNEDLTFINELIPELLPDRDLSDSTITGREIIMAMAETASLKLRKTKESRPEDLKKIKELEELVKDFREEHETLVENSEKDIKDLEDLNASKQSEITRLNGVIEDLKKMLSETSDQHRQVKETAETLKKYVPVPNEMRIVLPPFTNRVLTLYAEKIRLRTKAEITPGEILLSLFNRYITKRETELPGFPFLVSKNEIASIAKELENEQASE